MNERSPLETWRAEVRPLLNSVSWYAYRVRQFAELIEKDIGRISKRELFETAAEHDLEQAKAYLTTSLSKIDLALNEYRKKEVA